MAAIDTYGRRESSPRGRKADLGRLRLADSLREQTLTPRGRPTTSGSRWEMVTSSVLSPIPGHPVVPGTPARCAPHLIEAILSSQTSPRKQPGLAKIPCVRKSGRLPADAVLAAPEGSPYRGGRLNTPRGFARPEALSSDLKREPRPPSAADSVGSSPRRRQPRRKTLPPSQDFWPKMDAAMIRRLLQETSMTRTELYRLFNRFKALCQLSGTPGSIDKKTFKEGVSSLAFEDDIFVDRIFQLLDEDGSGSVEWDEFVNAVNALETGSPHDKLSFCFRVYDHDGNNSIERVELQHMFTSMLLFDTSDGQDDSQHFSDSISPALRELIDDFVDSIYDSLDADRSGSLEFHEVLTAIEKRKVADVWEIFGRTLVSRI